MGPLIPSDLADVGVRLRATPDVQRVPAPNLELFIVKHFLRPDLCGQLIERIDRHQAKPVDHQRHHLICSQTLYLYIALMQKTLQGS